jgi:hypothetical protein
MVRPFTFKGECVETSFVITIELIDSPLILELIYECANLVALRSE